MNEALERRATLAENRVRQLEDELATLRTEISRREERSVVFRAIALALLVSLCVTVAVAPGCSTGFTRMEKMP